MRIGLTQLRTLLLFFGNGINVSCHFKGKAPLFISDCRKLSCRSFRPRSNSCDHTASLIEIAACEGDKHHPCGIQAWGRTLQVCCRRQSSCCRTAASGRLTEQKHRRLCTVCKKSMASYTISPRLPRQSGRSWCISYRCAAHRST